MTLGITETDENCNKNFLKQK